MDMMKKEFAQWSVLLKEYLKRDWKLICGWVLGMTAFAGGFVPFFAEIGKGNGLAGMFETMKNPAMISLCGPTPVETAAGYTVGAMYGHLMTLFCALTSMLVAAVHMVRHTRKEEENGLTELICAYRVGRHAGSLAVLMEEVLIHAVMTVLIGVLMLVFAEETITAGPAFLFAACVGIGGVMGAVIALIMAQLMPGAPGATGSALGIIGLLYIMRAGTDIGSTGLSMLNPMGWVYLTYPFTENRCFPLLFALLFCIAGAAVALTLERGRDMGAGYLPERKGKGKVSPLLLSAHGLLLRLNTGVIIGWCITFIVLGATYGSIYGDMQSFLEGNELMKMMFTMSGVSLEASFTSTILVVLGGLAAILPALIVNKLFAEEAGGRLGQLCATKVSRARLYWTDMALAVLAGVTALAAAAAGLGGAAVSVMEKGELKFCTFLGAGLNYFPAVLFITALAALALGWAPKLGRAVYVYLVYSIMMNYFQGLLDMPEWLEDTAVLSLIPRMPVDEFDGIVFAGITAVSAVMMIIGYFGYRKRDMIEQA